LGEFQGLAPIGKRVEDVRPSTCSMSPVARSWSTGETATIRPTSCPSMVFPTFRERQLSAIHILHRNRLPEHVRRIGGVLGPCSCIAGRREQIVGEFLLHNIATGCNPDRIVSHRNAYSAGMRTSGNSPYFVHKRRSGKFAWLRFLNTYESIGLKSASRMGLNTPNKTAALVGAEAVWLGGGSEP
jgi:hypothetical protein